MRPIVLTIAGSDPSAGAGIQADLKAIEANGAYAATAVTAITVQNTRGTTHVEPLATALVRAQVLAVFEDLDVAAVKSGLLPDEETVREVSALLRDQEARPFVLDPVLAGSDGTSFQSRAARDTLLTELFPLATLVTPNAEEAQRLTGVEVETQQQARAAGERLLELGAHAVLIKGGHLVRDRGTDTLVTRETVREFSGEWIDTPHTHGTGCVYSAAIAAALARGIRLEDAIARAREYLGQTLRHALALGAGRGPTDALYALHGPIRPAVGESGDAS